MIVRTERKGDGMAITHLVKVGDVWNDCARRRDDPNKQYSEDKDLQLVARIPAEAFMKLSQDYPEEVSDKKKLLKLIQTLPELQLFRTTNTRLA